MSISPTLPEHGVRMSFEEFQALQLPPDSPLSLYGGVVFVDDCDSGPGTEMTKRSRLHAQVESRVSYLLHCWLENTKYRGKIFSGEVGCHDAKSGFDAGIDVAIFTDKTLAASGNATYIEGLPELAVEVVSPSDQHSKVKLKVDAYLEAGVPLVWVIDPCFQTVAIHTDGKAPSVISGDDIVSGDDLLAGFSVPASQFFK